MIDDELIATTEKVVEMFGDFVAVGINAGELVALHDFDNW